MRSLSPTGVLYIGLTIVLTVYGQLMLKWRMNLMGPLPPGLPDAIRFILHALCDPYVLSTYAAAFLASLTWMAALTKFELTSAYPFMSLCFVLTLLLGVLLLGERWSVGKVLGTVLIVIGVAICCR